MNKYNVLIFGIVSSMIFLVITAIYIIAIPNNTVVNVKNTITVLWTILMLIFMIMIGKSLLRRYRVALKPSQLLQRTRILSLFGLLCNLIPLILFVSAFGFWPEYHNGRALIWGFIGSSVMLMGSLILSYFVQEY